MSRILEVLRPVSQSDDSITFEFIENIERATSFSEDSKESSFGPMRREVFKQDARRSAAKVLATQIDSGSLDLDDSTKREKFIESAADIYLDKLDQQLLQEVNYRKNLKRVKFNETLNSISSKAGKVLGFLQPKSKILHGLAFATGLGLGAISPGSMLTPGSLAFWAAYPYAATSAKRFAPWLTGKVRGLSTPKSPNAVKDYVKSASGIFSIDNVNKIGSAQDFNKYFKGKTDAHKTVKDRLKSSVVTKLDSAYSHGSDKMDFGISVLDEMDYVYDEIISGLTPNKFGLGAGSTGILSKGKLATAGLLAIGGIGIWQSGNNLIDIASNFITEDNVAATTVGRTFGDL